VVTQAIAARKPVYLFCPRYIIYVNNVSITPTPLIKLLPGGGRGSLPLLLKVYNLHKLCKCNSNPSDKTAPLWGGVRVNPTPTSPGHLLPLGGQSTSSAKGIYYTYTM